MNGPTPQHLVPWPTTLRVAVPGKLYVASEEVARKGLAFYPDVRGIICTAHNVSVAYDRVDNLAWLRLDVDDYDRVPVAYFDLALAFHRAFTPTLIHCLGGRNRSVAFAVALMAVEYGIAVDEGMLRLNSPTDELLSSICDWVAYRHGLSLPTQP